MAKTTLILVRHGETEWNSENRLQGHKDSPLTLNGKKQALRVKETLDSLDIHGAYVSPLKRAVDTAGIILSDRDLQAVEADNLKEIALGPWEGETKEETKRTHPGEYANFWNEPHRFSLRGAETLRQLQERLVSEIQNIFEANEGKCVLIVTHWIAIKTVVAHFSSVPISQLSTLPDLPNGEYVALVKEGENITVAEQALD